MCVSRRPAAKRLEFAGKIIIFVNGAQTRAPPQWLMA
jgi:hypothetical protein